MRVRLMRTRMLSDLHRPGPCQAIFWKRVMSIEAKNDVLQSVTDLPKIIWALVLFIGGIAYVAMKARRAKRAT
jgi:hypothetical protein